MTANYETAKNYFLAANRVARANNKCLWLVATKQEPFAFEMFDDKLTELQKAADDALAAAQAMRNEVGDEAYVELMMRAGSEIGVEKRCSLH